MGKVIDLTGQRFGRLKVIRRVKNDKHYKAQFLCKCDCGNKIIAESHNLRSGNTSSCGCFRKELIVDRCRIDLTGQRFSRLIVIEYSHTNGKIAYWKCLCDCGNKTLVSTQQLKRKGYKNTRSCGCLQKERISEICGPNHYNWKDTLTYEEREIGRFYPEYYEWRKQVYERDDFICQCCKNRSGNLNAHHIESFNDNPDLRTTIENGITLCKKCHNNFHHKYGKGYNTRSQLEKFLGEYNDKKRNQT